MTIRKPRPEDIEEADWLDRRAALTQSPKEAQSLRELADWLRNPVSIWPVEDAPRSSGEVHYEVLDELGDLHAYDPRTDSFVLLPVRVALHDGLELHIGPYDLGPKDISVLRRAIVSYDRIRAAVRTQVLPDARPSVAAPGEVADE